MTIALCSHVHRANRLLRMVLGLVFVSPRALAAESDFETIRLVYQVPAPCPSVGAFVAEVRRSAPRLRLAGKDDSARTFLVNVQDEHPAKGRLTVTKDGAIVGLREVEGATCEEVSRVLAFAVALAVDPNAKPPPERAPSSSDSTTSPSADAPSRTWWAVSAHALAASGLAPNATFGGGPSVELGRSAGSLRPAIRLGLEYSSSAPASADGARVAFSNALLSLEVCPTTWDFGRVSFLPCARFDGGARIATGEGIPDARTVVRPWVDLGAMAHLRIRVAGPLFADLAGGALFAAVQDRVFLSPDVTVHTVPALGGRGEIALGVAFR